jgi:pimeloyl-ACP methyl ester carboxylesterase
MDRRTFLGAAAVALTGCVGDPNPPPLEFYQTRFATARDGVRIAYRDSGQVGGRAILFCNGGGQAMAVWNRIAEPLAYGNGRVLLHDRRGTGESETGAPETHTFETFRDDAFAVMDAAGVRKAVVCGLAFGSRVAVRMALDEPQRLDGLVLFDATGARPAPEAQRIAGAEEAERLRAAAGIPTPPRDPAWTAMKYPEARGLNARALQGHPDWIAGLSSIRVPTLVALGEQDPNFAGGQRMAQEIPGARFETMPMTGHGSNTQRPDLLLVLIKDFLKQNQL